VSAVAGGAAVGSAAAVPELVALGASAGGLEEAVGAAISAGAVGSAAAGAAVADELPLEVALSIGALAELDDDSLAAPFESSSEAVLEELGVEAAWRDDFATAVCLGVLFSLGAGFSSGSFVAGVIGSSAFATTGAWTEFVSATSAAGGLAGSAVLLTVVCAVRTFVPSGVDQTWSRTSAPPTTATTIVPNAIGK
jgi:hypothetical protein